MYYQTNPTLTKADGFLYFVVVLHWWSVLSLRLTFTMIEKIWLAMHWVCVVLYHYGTHRLCHETIIKVLLLKGFIFHCLCSHFLFNLSLRLFSVTCIESHSRIVHQLCLSCQTQKRTLFCKLNFSHNLTPFVASPC